MTISGHIDLGMSRRRALAGTTAPQLVDQPDEHREADHEGAYYNLRHGSDSTGRVPVVAPRLDMAGDS
jgi:hypothetical protein